MKLSTAAVAISYCIAEVKEDARLLRDEEATKLAKQAEKELKAILKELKRLYEIEADTY